MEDGVPQQVSNFNVSRSADHGCAAGRVRLDELLHSCIDALKASYSFANSLKKDDWIAVTYYDMQPHILVDFTQDKRAVYGALNQLRIPGFAETNRLRCALRHARSARPRGRQEVRHPDLDRRRHLQQADARQDPEEDQRHERCHDLPDQHRLVICANIAKRTTARRSPQRASGIPVETHGLPAGATTKCEPSRP